MSRSTWEELGLSEYFSEKLYENGLKEPTAVQSEAIPAWIEGKDIAVKSQTGSGKTLAFLLPILQHIDIESKAIQAMVLAPTQELAMQLVRVAEAYGAEKGVRIQQLIGGAAVKRQIEKLKQSPHLIIGTPGRMNELVKSKKIKLHQVKFLVLDEADQIFELGTSADIENLLFNVNKHRQTAFFSATYPESMGRYEGRWANDPLKISISPAHKVASSIEHYYVISDRRSKLDTVRRLLRTINAHSALMFLNDTDQISNWETKLKYEGFKIEALYGEADKQQRASTLTQFREGKLDALLSTDVSARGIDIVDLPLVIQIEPAIDADHYVHRAGRTGRMGKKGVVISVITPQEKFIMDKFNKQLQINIEERIMFRGKLLSEDEVAAVTSYKPVLKPTSRAASVVKTKQQEVSTSEQVKAGDKSSKLLQRSTKTIHNGEKPLSANKGKLDKKTIAPASAKKNKKPVEGKNKGAPKWLKAKREQSKQQ